MKSITFLFAVLLLSASAHASTTGQKPRKPSSHGATEADARKQAKKLGLACKDNADPAVERIDMKYRFSYATEKDPEESASYFLATCPTGKGANSSSVLLFVHDNLGLQPVALASVVVNESNKVVGYTADVVVPALTYNADTQELVTIAKGKSKSGDAVTHSATYKFVDGVFMLRKHTMNASTVFESKEAAKYF